MKKNSSIRLSQVSIFTSLIILTPGLLQGQGTLVDSNLGTASGSDQVNYTQWIAQSFETGNNPQGYTLNSVEVQMAAATGSPSGFTLAIFSAADQTSQSVPALLIGNLTGSFDPTTAGVYSYDASGVNLAPSTEYFLVESATTTSSQGSFGWDFVVGGGPTGWQNISPAFSSDQGNDWSPSSRFAFQMAIYATPVPEPSPWILLAWGGGILLWVRSRRA